MVNYKVYLINNEKYLSPSLEFLSWYFKNQDITEIKINSIKEIEYILVKSRDKKKLIFDKVPSSDLTINEYIKFLPHYKKFSSEAQLSKFINKTTKQVKVKKKAKPLDGVGENLRTFEESTKIANSINYYLNKLGLKPLSTKNQFNYKDFFRFSSVGDSLIKIETQNIKLFDKVNSNKWMKKTLIELGFEEIANCGTHISGSLFETIYYFAWSQKNEVVLNKLISALTKDMDTKENKIIYDMENFQKEG